MNNLTTIIQKIKENQVVAYPTEAVFGLGCNPHSEEAVRRLLCLKQRPEEKGLILIAPSRAYFSPFIDETALSEAEWQRFEQHYDRAISWIMPAKSSVPRYLKGQFETIAARLCQVPAVVELCAATGAALTSTSANLTGLPPCRTADEVRTQFGEHFPVLNGQTEGRANPSEIRDIFTQHIFRQG